MDKFEVGIVLNGKFEHLPEEQITSEMLIRPWKFDKNLHELVVTLESEDQKKAISEAKKMIDDFLSLYYFQSLDLLSIGNSQDSVRNLTTNGPENRCISAFMQPHDPFKIDEFNKLKDDFLKMISSSDNNYLKIALNYFRRGRLETYQENRIIDFFVSLEALYSLSGEKTEMRYRISNRLATLIGKDANDRKKIQKESRDLYDLRSSIVHGSKINLDERIQGSIYYWVRDSIIRFMGMSQTIGNQEKILEKIDYSMIENSDRDSLRKESDKYCDLIRDLN